MKFYNDVKIKGSLWLKILESIPKLYNSLCLLIMDYCFEIDYKTIFNDKIVFT